MKKITTMQVYTCPSGYPELIKQRLLTYQIPEVTVDRVLSVQGSRPDILMKRRPELADLTRKAIQIITDLARPELTLICKPVHRKDHRFIYLDEHIRLEGKTIERALRPADGAIVFFATLGSGVDVVISNSFKEDPALAYAMDASASCLIDSIGTIVCQVSEDVMNQTGLRTGIPISPGAPDWDAATGHRQLGALFAGLPLNIKINSSGMMTPVKSISMLIPYGRQMDQSSRSCDFCAMSATCTYKPPL
ncbi:hypothetical protein [Leptolinea tardivitalis]|nr:hypothetical protein [Leptolinea tardivitalis]